LHRVWHARHSVSELFRQGQKEATAYELRAIEFKARGGNANPALETAMWNLKAMNDRMVSHLRQASQSGNDQDIRVDGYLNILVFNAWDRDHHPKLTFGFEDVDGRLPACFRRANQTRSKELTLKALGPID
jgi:hypothetical protein